MSKTIEIIHLKQKRSQNVSLPEGSIIEDATTEVINIEGQATSIPALIVRTTKNKAVDVREIMIYKTGEEFGEFDIIRIGKTTVNGERLHIYENGN